MRYAPALIALALAIGIVALADAQDAAAPQPDITVTMPPVMDSDIYAHALLDQNEGRIGGGQNGYRWEGQAWAGTDYNKILA